mgnify:CR=1 FL=1
MVDSQHPSPGAAGTLYTVGHSNRSLDEFLEVLHTVGIQQLIDVRSHPSSRRFPVFNRSPLRQALADEDMAYAWLGHELGGRRRERSDSPHTALASDGFRGYADHMATPLFQQGMAQVTALARQAKVALMCAERDPAQCHRSLLADYLVLHHWEVIHLIDTTQRQGHQLNPLARAQGRLPVYDQLHQEQLDLSFD